MHIGVIPFQDIWYQRYKEMKESMILMYDAGVLEDEKELLL
jgi:hypothetical protein